ncbi:acyl-CoA dehydratase activase [Youngiibacter fragilis]|uniref:2-hydroxyglutaryl-CoA dehydratase n=1 Tax=Youngiibacter fragilis 232.1 TaxID=994573 RepID=V7I560_9CLOT|nr:acyl-CoA dehydratase activase [Youngiibacter fragilis]ETA80092.1 2-hydroxyglutaryl-CoA dehydratase [Youngiibacter fragilis 232.1]
MVTLGIDIGSTTSKCVLLRNGVDIVAKSLVPGGIGTSSPDRAVAEALEKSGLGLGDISYTVVTGYGRTNFKSADMQVSELSCHAIGGRFVFPKLRTIIDIGGQDVKVVSLSDSGKMVNFLMNDKCAAGTGRFLDVMAGVLQIKLSDIENLAAIADKPSSISSTCTVFAESEVISQLANGATIPNVVAGICDSVASRTASMVKRIGVTEQVCMGGGVAQNGGVRKAIEKSLGVPIAYSPLSQLFGALGAAIYAYNKINQVK